MSRQTTLLQPELPNKVTLIGVTIIVGLVILGFAFATPVSADDPDAVEIIDTNSPVDPGETVEVTVKVTNTGDDLSFYHPHLYIDGEEKDDELLSLSGGESETVTLEWESDTDDAGDFTATVELLTGEEDSTTVTVEQEDPVFGVEMLDTNSPVESGETLEVTAEVENLGQTADSEDISLELDGVEKDDVYVELDGGESQTVTLEWDTTLDDDGAYTATVASDDEEDAAEVEIGQVPDPYVVWSEDHDEFTGDRADEVAYHTESDTLFLVDGSDLISVDASTQNVQWTIDSSIEPQNVIFNDDYVAISEEFGESVLVYDRDTEEKIGEFDHFTVDIEMDSDGQIYVGGFDGVETLAVDGGEVVHTGGFGSDGVGLALDDDERYLAAGSTDSDDNIVVYDTETENRVADMSMGTDVEQVHDIEFVEGQIFFGWRDDDHVHHLTAIEWDEGGESLTQNWERSGDLDPSVGVEADGRWVFVSSAEDWEGESYDLAALDRDDGRYAWSLEEDTGVSPASMYGLSATPGDSQVNVFASWFDRVGAVNDGLAPSDEALFQVDLIDTNSPVEMGETLEVTADINNIGDEVDSQDIVLEVDGVERDVVLTELNGSESQTVTLEWDTSLDDDGGYTATVASDDDEASESVSIQDLGFFEVRIIDTNAPIEETEVLEVTAEIDNVGGDRAHQFIALELDGVEKDDVYVELDGGESQTVTLEWDTTGPGNVGDHTATVASDDDEASRVVTVERIFPPDILWSESVYDTVPHEPLHMTYDEDTETFFLAGWNNSVEGSVHISAVDASTRDAIWTKDLYDNETSDTAVHHIDAGRNYVAVDIGGTIQIYDRASQDLVTSREVNALSTEGIQFYDGLLFVGVDGELEVYEPDGTHVANLDYGIERFEINENGFIVGFEEYEGLDVLEISNTDPFEYTHVTHEGVVEEGNDLQSQFDVAWGDDMIFVYYLDPGDRLRGYEWSPESGDLEMVWEREMQSSNYFRSEIVSDGKFLYWAKSSTIYEDPETLEPVTALHVEDGSNAWFAHQHMANYSLDSSTEVRAITASKGDENLHILWNKEYGDDAMLTAFDSGAGGPNIYYLGVLQPIIALLSVALPPLLLILALVGLTTYVVTPTSSPFNTWGYSAAWGGAGGFVVVAALGAIHGTVNKLIRGESSGSGYGGWMLPDPVVANSSSVMVELVGVVGQIASLSSSIFVMWGVALAASASPRNGLYKRGKSLAWIGLGLAVMSVGGALLSPILYVIFG